MAQTPYNMNGGGNTAGAAEETLNMSLNGAAGAAATAVAANTRFNISDVCFSGAAATNFSIQQTNDGVAWFDIYQTRLAAAGTIHVTLGTAITVTGGAAVSVRMRVETPGGAAAVTSFIGGTLNND